VIDAILDTGPLVGALDRDDQWHPWAAKQFAAIAQPALTCDAVISEACFLLRHTRFTGQDFCPDRTRHFAHCANPA
jgi:uncharacterized protein